MYGTRFTLIGLSMALIGLILLTIWLFVYSGGKPVVDRGTESTDTSGSPTFLIGFFFSIIGILLCFFGFIQSAEHSARRTSPKLNNKTI